MSLDPQKYYFQREEIVGRISKAGLLGTKGTEEHIPSKSLFSPMTKVPLGNSCFSMQKKILRKMKDFAKN